MNVHVLLSVAAVCKPSVAALELTLERFLSWRMEKKKGGNLVRYIDIYTETGLEMRPCERQKLRERR